MIIMYNPSRLKKEHVVILVMMLRLLKMVTRVMKGTRMIAGHSLVMSQKTLSRYMYIHVHVCKYMYVQCY